MKPYRANDKNSQEQTAKHEKKSKEQNGQAQRSERKERRCWAGLCSSNKKTRIVFWILIRDPLTFSCVYSLHLIVFFPTTLVFFQQRLFFFNNNFFLEQTILKKKRILLSFHSQQHKCLACTHAFMQSGRSRVFKPTK
jgi:hypothetical protein